jgi:peptidoglycan hydrolase-like protein with peptidoglycan-binding domain
MPSTEARAERRHPSPSRRPDPRRRAHDRLAARPDRLALWALVMAFALLAAAAATAEGATRLGDRVLRPGMEGRDVRHLQLRLRGLGLLRAGANAHFGPQTLRAVRAYQRSRCLRADGLVGPATVRALRSGRRACRRARGARTSGAARRAPARVALGVRALRRGHAGTDVRTLQHLLGVSPTGEFGPLTARAVRALQRQAGLTADGVVGPATRSALVVHRMRGRTATWYGPGLYGRTTACGQRLTPALPGVAHRTLPCGTSLVLHRAGRFVTARVVDRGPFTGGVTLDLTAATARSLGLQAAEPIHSSR